MIFARDSFSVTDSYREGDPYTVRMPFNRPAEKLTVFVSTNRAYCQISEDEQAPLPDPLNPDELLLLVGFNSITFAKPITAIRFRCAVATLTSGIDYYRLYGYH